MTKTNNVLQAYEWQVYLEMDMLNANYKYGKMGLTKNKIKLVIYF